MKHIASVSFGKDSMAMLLLLIEKNYPLDEVVFYDTGIEFDAIYKMRDKALPLLKEKGIKYTELRSEKPVEYWMFEHPVKSRKTGEIHYGYGWCGGRMRWGTRIKITTMRNYLKQQGLEDVVQYIGIAADESKRLERVNDKSSRGGYKNSVFPLVDWGMTEEDCLKYCYEHGYTWEEEGHRLYDIISNLSCWCCRNKSMKNLEAMYRYLPKYWERLKDMQSRINYPMKWVSGSVFDLEQRFYLKSLQESDNNQNQQSDNQSENKIV